MKIDLFENLFPGLVVFDDETSILHCVDGKWDFFVKVTKKEDIFDFLPDEAFNPSHEFDEKYYETLDFRFKDMIKGYMLSRSADDIGRTKEEAEEAVRFYIYSYILNVAKLKDLEISRERYLAYDANEENK